LTDIEIENYIKIEGLKIEIDEEEKIVARDVLKGGRSECYVHE